MAQLGALLTEPIEPVPVRVLDQVHGHDPRALAFAGLVDRRLDEAYGLAAVILGDRLEAEDLVHDAAVTAWRAWPSLRDPGRLDAWFQRIVVNACRDRLRHRKHERLRFVGREAHASEHPASAAIEDGLLDRELVGQALETLSPEAKVVVVLRYESDLTVPQIADLLGLPEGTVKSRLHGALARLRSVLEVGQ